MKDYVREADIINATQHEIRRISVADKNLQNVHEQVTAFVEYLKEIKIQTIDFKAWDFEDEQNPDKYIELGYIDIKNDVAFRTMVNAI